MAEHHALVVEQTYNTGKPVLDLLDEIDGHPAAKGQLRRLWFGVLRELAMQRETVRALRAKYEAGRDADLEAWKAAHMVNLDTSQEVPADGS